MFKTLLYWWNTEKSGLQKLSHDIRDLKLRDILGSDPYTPQFKTKKLAPVWVKDQLGHANCSFQDWSAVLGIYFGENISARWLTAKAYQLGLCNKGGEADLRSGVKIAQKYGVVLESDLPSDEGLSWDEYVNIDFAKYNAIAQTKKIGSYYGIDTIDEYLMAIDKGYAVAIGRTWLTGMNQGGGFTAPWILKRTGLSVGGHATAGVGYDLTKNTDIEVNSYSDKWGDKGYFYCPFTDLVKDFKAYGAYALTEIPYTPKEIKLNFLRRCLEAALKLLSTLKKNPMPQAETRLNQFCLAIQAHEGWTVGEIKIVDTPASL